MKNNLTEMKNAFNWLISRINMTKERITVDLSSENMENKRQCSEIFEVLKEKSTNLEFYIQQKYLSIMEI